MRKKIPQTNQPSIPSIRKNKVTKMEGNLQKLLCIRAIITINYTVILNIPWMADVSTSCIDVDIA